MARSVAIMNKGIENSLWNIGLQLDRDHYPHVYNGGVVQPGDAAIVASTPGEDMNNVEERQARSAAGSRQGTTRRQGSPMRPGPPGQAPQLVSSSLRSTYEAELDALRGAYPGAKIWQQAEGMWLLTESTVLTGLEKTATFLTAIPFSPLYPQKSWGFWTTPVYWEWIGARHTNFGDGSICAFDPKDGTWKPGDSLITLLDLYTLWALRHEHLKVLGRWPGRQTVPHAYERLSESHPDELCGCDRNGQSYAACCQHHDQTLPLGDSFFQFMKFTQNQLDRSPPEDICKFMAQRKSPPPLKDYLQPLLLPR